MSSDQVRTQIRFPIEIMLELRKLAKSNSRSVNGEVIYRLQESIRSEMESKRSAA